MSLAHACKACNGPTEWDASVGSRVCTECGTLEDAGQTVLASDLEPHERNARGGSSNAHGAVLKSLRKPGWDLDGQSKEARVHRNRVAMHGFIRALAGRLGHPGAIERATFIFDTVMERGELRWGRRAKLAAAASLALALRESELADPLRDLAVLTGESIHSVAKAFTQTTTLLGHHASSADPSLHIQPLVSHLSSVLNTAPPALPSPILKLLKPLLQNLLSIQRMAELLCALLNRAQTFIVLPPGPVAAGALLLTLEALARAQLPSLGALAGVLGGRVGAAASTILVRYRAARRLAEEWTHALPWVQKYHLSKGGKRATSGEGKRTLVARALKDALDFQEDIWRKKVGDVLFPDLCESGDSDEAVSSSASSGGLISKPKGVKRPAEADAHEVAWAEGVLRSHCFPKRRKTASPAVDGALVFLLGGKSSRNAVRYSRDSNDASSLLGHLLVTDVGPLARRPSRLQVLASSRGGAAPEHIADEELFEPGELEGFLRDEQERDTLARIVDWDDDVLACAPVPRARQKVQPPKGHERIDMSRLALMLHADDDEDVVLDKATSDISKQGWDNLVNFDDDKDEDDMFPHMDSFHDSASPAVSGNAVVADEDEAEDWRPPSPISRLDISDWYEF